MSPHIRTMLEDAADDGGRALPLDLDAVRTAGRRATWRQRALVGGGAIGAAAVITSVAFVLAPGEAAPSDNGVTSPSEKYAGDPGAAGLAEVLTPLIEPLEQRGYETTIEYDGGSSGGSDSGKESRVDAIGLIVEKDGTTGSAVVAEFTDRAALALTGEGFRELTPCAAVPVVHAETFVWDTCQPVVDTNYWFATGGDDTGESLGVTLVRSDGTGLSVVVSTMPNDPERIDPPTPPLASVPLTHRELLEVVGLLEARTPLSPPMPPEPTMSPTPPPDVPPGTDPCDDAVPAFHECVLVGGVSISTLALIDALTASGLTVDKGDSHEVLDVAGTMATSAVLTFHLSDAEGRAGSAAIGVFDSLDAARMFDGNGDPAAGGDLTWCAVAPSGPVLYRWNLADDPAAVCDGIEAADADRTIVVMNDESDGGAIGATLIRPDGSVVTVSVSQAPLVTISAQLTPLTEVPLDRAAILEVLRGVAAAIHGDGIEVIGAGAP